MKIAFRKCKQGLIDAVFLNEIHSYDYQLTCYAHTGQHSACSIDWLYQDTTPATQAEYKDLLNELTNSIGYTYLEVVNRLPAYSKTVALFNKGA